MDFYPIHLKSVSVWFVYEILWNETKILKFDEKPKRKGKKKLKRLKFNFRSQFRISRDKNLFCLIYIRWLIFEKGEKTFDYNKQFVCSFCEFGFFWFVHSKANLNLSSGRKQWMPVQLIKRKIYCIISISWEVHKWRNEIEATKILKPNYRLINVSSAIDFFRWSEWMNSSVCSEVRIFHKEPTETQGNCLIERKKEREKNWFIEDKNLRAASGKVQILINR